MTPEEFIETMNAYAPVVKLRGYFPSVFLAQAALESGWGKSVLAEKANNFWGHKWKPELDPGRYEWTAKVSNEEMDGEMVPLESRFRVYPTMNIAVNAYCDKWEETWPDGSRKYDPDLSGPREFVESIAGRYCNDSKYVGKIMGIIREWELEQYD